MNQKSLCLSCGLCCDGTIFEKAPLESGDDPAPLKIAGFEIRTKVTKEKKIRKFFSLPCVEFQQNCCRIYNDRRPAICSRYRCDLLKKHESGEIDRQEAEQKISRVLELREIVKIELEQILPGSGKLPITAVLKVIPQPEEMTADPKLLKKWSAVMLNLSALLDCLQTYFQPPRRKSKGSSEKSKNTEV